MWTQRIHSSCLVMACLVLGLSGCSGQFLNLSTMFPKNEQETETNSVEQIVPVWQEAEGPGLDDQVVTRGFGGQIYFITRNRGMPSEVQGSVRVYLFDEQGPNGDPSEPLHYFDFKPEAWKMHQIQTKLGAAYTVFVPYTRPGYNQAQCALRIRYKPLNGPAIFSQLVSISLPGSRPNAPSNTEDGGRTIREIEQPDQPQVQRKSPRRKAEIITAVKPTKKRALISQTSLAETVGKPSQKTKLPLTDHSHEQSPEDSEYDSEFNSTATEESSEEWARLTEADPTDENPDNSEESSDDEETSLELDDEQAEVESSLRTYTIKLD